MTQWPYRGYAYGLIFGSEIPLPELAPTRDMGDPGAVDVVVRLGGVPDRIQPVRRESPHSLANEREYRLAVPEIGRYYVREGREIRLDPDPGCALSEARVFLLGTCMGVLLNQRGMLVVHASGIATDKGAVLFAGHSGMGKSTLLQEMLRRGYQMVVDDVCAVSRDVDGHPLVIPAYPRTRVWQETADRFDIPTEGLQRTRASMDKYELQLNEGFAPAPIRLHSLYVLVSAPGAPVAVDAVEKMMAFQAVSLHTYRGQLLDGLGRREDHFRAAGEVAAQVRVVRALRPSDDYRLEELASAILDDLDRAP